MAGHVSDSHLAKVSFTASKPRLPLGWPCMVIILWSAVSSSAPHCRDAVEAMLHLCITDRKRSTPVRRRLNPTYAGLGSPIPGGRASTSSKNEYRQEVPYRLPMLHRWSAHLAALVPRSLVSLSSSRAAGTKECLDLSCRCPSYG